MKIYDSDAEARHFLRAFMGLALLPIDRIHEGFYALKEKVKDHDQHDQIKPFINYFRKWMD